MSEETQPGNQFIDSWLQSSRESDDLDQDIIELIDTHRDDWEIDEVSFLNALLDNLICNPDK